MSKRRYDLQWNLAAIGDAVGDWISEHRIAIVVSILLPFFIAILIHVYTYEPVLRLYRVTDYAGNVTLVKARYAQADDGCMRFDITRSKSLWLWDVYSVEELP